MKWKKEALQLRQEADRERIGWAEAAAAWQSDWAEDLRKQHFEASAHQVPLIHHVRCFRGLPR